MTLTIHAAGAVAVPIPGQLPAWSPVSVKFIDTQTETQTAPVIRRDGYLWVGVPAGVHQIAVSGLLPDVTDWQWTYRLKPHHVIIDAPGWKHTGINAGGVPGDQVFFVREQTRVSGGAAYDREHFKPIFAVERQLELGLQWKVRTVVRRITAAGKAASLSIPLLPGEQVLTSSQNVSGEAMMVSMSAEQTTVQWDSELPVGGTLMLAAAPTDRYVERYELRASPIWHVDYTGIDPVFESGPELVPVWRPWPSETITLTLTQPVAVEGETMTIQRVAHTTTLGRRQRTDQLDLSVHPSLATDLMIELEPNAEVTELRRGAVPLPVRRDGDRLVVPTVPGEQNVIVRWQTNLAMQTVVAPQPVGLEVAASNVSRTLIVPTDRWVLWADGPLLGPAIRFWVVIVVSILIALALGAIPGSPIGRISWVLLLIGLTQVPWPLAAIVAGWLFALSWRGRAVIQSSPSQFNLMQLAIALLTAAALMVLVGVVARGLLGHPDMFILGNGSTRRSLRWFESRIDGTLPSVRIVSISVWYYRLAMLLWALWLSASLLRWLRWGWDQYSRGGIWRSQPSESPA